MKLSFCRLAESGSDVQVPERVGANQQVPGDLAGPRLCVDEVVPTARACGRLHRSQPILNHRPELQPDNRTKANQSALEALQLEVDGKSTPASVDLKLANHPTTAAMNSAIASANNAVLASVAATCGLKTVTDQLTIDVAARQTAADVDQKIATALLPYTDSTGLNATVALRTTPADVDQTIATALLTYVQQVVLDAALAIRDGRLDAAEAAIETLQAAGYQTAAQVSSAIALPPLGTWPTTPPAPTSPLLKLASSPPSTPYWHSCEVCGQSIGSQVGRRGQASHLSL